MTRRRFVYLTGATAALAALTGVHAKSPPLVARGADRDGGSALRGLATSLTDEYDYEPEVRGALPDLLRGTLYRNGPGLFDRAGLRKRNLLDGDGLVQAFRIDPARGVHFQARFVQTAKYVAEQRAGRFLFATWTTQAPGGVFANLFGRSMRDQAGVTVIVRDGRLYAFDESAEPYELDPGTLETIGVSHLGLPEHTAVFAAHSKVDARTGEWLHFGLEYGRGLTLHLTVFDKHGQLKSHTATPMPRYVYLHDFFVSDRHIILNLHPAEISILPFILGQRSLADSIRWRPQEGNLLMILDRSGGAAPLLIATDATWMWHALNAYERGQEIIADFVGYENPDHFLGPDPQFSAIMSGRQGTNVFPGQVRRYVIDLQAQRVRHEIVDPGRHEYPFVNPFHGCHRHRVGYFSRAWDGDPYFSGIARIEMDSGRSESYRFGSGQYCGEPVFAARPGTDWDSDAVRDPGWLLTEVYDSSVDKSFLAILDAEHVVDGPVATIHLRHHLPISLHGYWHGSA